MNEDRSTSDTGIRSLTDYDVVDKDNHKIGKVESFWEDSSGQPAFLSIRTGWLGMGRSYIVPTHSVEANEKSRIVRLPYDEETIKNAPEFATESEIDRTAELRIYEYYLPFGKDIPQGSAYDWSPAAETDQVDYPSQEPGEGIADRESGVPAEDRSGEGSLTLKEESVHVGKRSESAGGVRIRKVVRTETVNQPVELEREEIVVEKVPASPEAAAESAFKEEEIFIPLRRERAEVTKTAQVTGEVKATKRTKKDAQEITETVRKEDVEVDQEPGPEQGGR